MAGTAYEDLGRLVERAANRDARAWDALVDRCGEMVWAVARSHRLNDADAADVSQATWLRLLVNIDRINDPSRVAGWLATTARREALRLLRGRCRDDVALPDDFDDHDLAPGLDDRLLTEERDEELWRIFALLPERSQTLLRLLLGDDPRSYRDLSVELDMPIGSIGPTRQRAVDHLRRLVDVEGRVLVEAS